MELDYEATELTACPLCGSAEYVSEASASLSRMPVSLHYHGGNGKMQTYHYACVTQAVADAVRRKCGETILVTNGENLPGVIVTNS